LKTALDYSWLQVIRKLVPAAEAKYAKFPIYPTVNDLKSALIGRAIDTTSPRLFSFIVSDMKPYDGGDDSVYAIHKMDIMDKHRLLIPARSHGNVSGLKFKEHAGGIFFSEELPETFTITVGPGLTIQDKGCVAFNIVFKEGPMKLMPVSEVLEMFSMKVLKIMELMEKFIE
jgi:hypothetical protein